MISTRNQQTILLVYILFIILIQIKRKQYLGKVLILYTATIRWEDFVKHIRVTHLILRQGRSHIIEYYPLYSPYYLSLPKIYVFLQLLFTMLPCLNTYVKYELPTHISNSNFSILYLTAVLIILSVKNCSSALTKRPSC